MLYKKIILFFSLILLSPVLRASCGSVDYSQGAKALDDAVSFTVSMMTVMITLLYAIGAIVSVISALQISMKMYYGEGDITKSVVYLIGGILFIIGVSVVMPAFFGWNYLNTNF